MVKRIQAGWGSWKEIMGIMCNKRVPEKLKGQTYKTMVRPSMIYGMEYISVTKRQEEKMQVAKMNMLRWWTVGLTLKDRMRNEQVRARVAVGELTENLKEIRLRWLEHLVRSEESYVGKRVEVVVVGQRRRGKPRRRWRDCVRNDMEVMVLREETRNRKM